MIRLKEIKMVNYLTVFDTETCGTTEEYKFPIQVSAARWDLRKLPFDAGKAPVAGETETFDLLMRPNHDITLGASVVHNYLIGDLKDEQSPEEAWIKLENYRPWFEGADTLSIGWNVSFDQGVFYNWATECNKERIRFSNVIDMMTVAQRLFSPRDGDKMAVESFTLDAIYMATYEQAGMTVRQRLDKLHARRATHSSLEDVKMTMEVTRILLKMGIDRGFYTDMDGFLAWLEKPFKLEICEFKKHKGEKYTDIAVADRRYLDWLCTNPMMRKKKYRDQLYTAHLATGRDPTWLMSKAAFDMALGGKSKKASTTTSEGAWGDEPPPF